MGKPGGNCYICSVLEYGLKMEEESTINVWKPRLNDKLQSVLRWKSKQPLMINGEKVEVNNF